MNLKYSLWKVGLEKLQAAPDAGREEGSERVGTVREVGAEAGAVVTETRSLKAEEAGEAGTADTSSLKAEGAGVVEEAGREAYTPIYNRHHNVIQSLSIRDNNSHWGHNHNQPDYNSVLPAVEAVEAAELRFFASENHHHCPDRKPQTARSPRLFLAYLQYKNIFT